MINPNGIIVYEGPSRIDGAPIVVIATGMSGNASRNAKTGGLVQTWILRADISPVDAIKSGADKSICGDCPHRGETVDGRNVNRSCYVTVFQAPLVVWKAYKAGRYAKPANIAGLFAGKRVRLGAYGDPAAIPAIIWAQALQGAEAHTGYTHQWRNLVTFRRAELDQFQGWLMASCDNADDYLAAKNTGWRTFRVRRADEPLRQREVICPASHEAGQKTTCSACVACGGNGAKARVDIAIIAHGAASKVNAFNANRAA